MIDIHKIISQLYADKKYQDIKTKLDKWDFYTPINKAAILLNSALVSEKKLLQPGKIKSIQIGHIVSLLLTAVNQKLATINDQDEKNEYEELLSTICRKIIRTFYELTKSDQAVISYQLSVSLYDSCQFNDYDFEKLKAFLRLENEVFEMESQKHPSNVLMPNKNEFRDKVPCYCWKGEAKKKDEFMQLLADVTNIKKKEAYKLFEEPTTRLNLSFDYTKADLILHFFSSVKSMKLISTHGSPGFYQVLTYHVLDFEEKYLKKVAPKIMINRIKNNKTKYKFNNGKIEKWLEPFSKVKT